MENLLIVYSMMEFGIMEYLKTHIGKMEHGQMVLGKTANG